MIYLIAGASHTGKTRLAQELLDVYHFPYLSIDHLKMGLIRSGNTTLTPEDDELLNKENDKHPTTLEPILFYPYAKPLQSNKSYTTTPQNALMHVKYHLHPHYP